MQAQHSLAELIHAGALLLQPHINRQAGRRFRGAGAGRLALQV